LSISARCQAIAFTFAVRVGGEIDVGSLWQQPS
jgi:hypothetical protein